MNKYILIFLSFITIMAGCSSEKYEHADIIPNTGSLENDGFVYGVAQININGDIQQSLARVVLVATDQSADRDIVYGLHRLDAIGQGLFAFGGFIPAGEYAIRRLIFGVYQTQDHDELGRFVVKKGVINNIGTIHVNLAKALVNKSEFMPSRMRMKGQSYYLYLTHRFTDCNDCITRLLDLDQYKETIVAWEHFESVQTKALGKVGDVHSSGVVNHNGKVFLHTSSGSIYVYDEVDKTLDEIYYDPSVVIDSMTLKDDDIAFITASQGRLYEYNISRQWTERLNVFSEKYDIYAIQSATNQSLWAISRVRHGSVKTFEAFNNPVRGGQFSAYLELGKLEPSNNSAGYAYHQIDDAQDISMVRQYGIHNDFVYMQATARKMHLFDLKNELWSTIDTPFMNAKILNGGDYVSYKDSNIAKLAINEQKNMALYMDDGWVVIDLFSSGFPVRIGDDVYLIGRQMISLGEGSRKYVPDTKTYIFKYLSKDDYQVIVEAPDDCKLGDLVNFAGSIAIKCWQTGKYYLFDNGHFSLMFSPNFTQQLPIEPFILESAIPDLL